MSIDLIIYNAKDLAAAKKTLAVYLGAEPYADSPYYVGFRVGGLEVGVAQGDAPATTFSKVTDLKRAIAALVETGCTVVEEPHPVGGTRSIAVVKDAAGNRLGLMHDA
ncbi:MAG: hypothetical protein QM831_34200 [Kofleriaceae bacterium]